MTSGKIIDALLAAALVVTTLGGPAPAAMRDEMAARFEAYKYRRAQRDAEKRRKRQGIKTAYAKARTLARRYRLENPQAAGPTWAQRAYRVAYAQHLGRLRRDVCE